MPWKVLALRAEDSRAALSLYSLCQQITALHTARQNWVLVITDQDMLSG